ncbi:MAG: UvrD-helicase domain-containing protein, partial [Candidatus Binatia bacterium]
MTLDANIVALPDARDRELAVSTFDRNLVVTAGAGTGKTTLLVDRLVHLLLRNPEPLRITDIVALTFTNKAANEMKQRLRERLQAYLEVELDSEGTNDKNQREVSALIARYQLSKDELDRRVQDAIRNLERSDIGTIHSFAATILRLYPLEAGVDPQFREDDGREFDRLFDEQWDLWLDNELALNGQQRDDWRLILAKFTLDKLDKIKALAKSLAAEAVELRREPNDANRIAPPLRAWLEDLDQRAEALSERHPEERSNEKLVRAARDIIGEFLGGAKLDRGELAEARTLVVSKTIS